MNNHHTGYGLSGKRIAITGGGGHLGTAMTLRLLQEGARVLICGRSMEALLSARSTAEKSGLQDRLQVKSADVTKPEDLQSLLDWMVAEWGGVDGWVNNAGGAEPSLLGRLDAEKVQNTLNLSLVSAMIATDLASKVMISARIAGSIVNVASMYGVVSPQPQVYEHHPQFHNPPAYGAAKAGLIQFTKYAACHLAAENIRVNCISPGPFPKAAVMSESSFVEKLCQRVPLRRMGTCEEIGGPISFLLSSDSSYVTGHNLEVDGGWSAW